MNEKIISLVREYIKNTKAFKQFITNPTHPLVLSGLDTLPLSLTLSLWQNKLQKRVFLISPTEEIAKNNYNDAAIINDTPVLYFPSTGKVFYSSFSGSPAEYEQYEAMNQLRELKQGIVIMSLRTFLSPLITQQDLDNLSFTLKKGDDFNPTLFSEKLTLAGYFRSNSCYERGTYTIRGEIMEIFPFSYENPIRIYASWDEIEKIASYDASTQTAIKTLSKITISLINEGYSPDVTSFLDYLRADDYFFFNGKERLDISYKSFTLEAKAKFKEAYNLNNNAVTPDKYLLDFNKFLNEKNEKTIIYDIANKDTLNMGITTARSFMGNVTFFKEELRGYFKNNWKVVVVSPTIVQQERLEQVLREFKDVIYDVSDLSSGFSIDDKNLFVVLDSEIFGRRKVKAKAVVDLSSAPIDSFVDLKQGDFVVHVNHGIGKFLKIERNKNSRSERDYIKIQYAKDEFLYVPIEQANLVQRYIGSEGRKPKLDTLGGVGWTKKKEKAMKNAADLANQLITLYAQRQNSFGYPFQKDNDWQLQFEAAFPHTETPDQLTCIDDIKADMESDKVMDRLVCGDVGYGKTEIAFRAAFKAVMSGKQVAFLAPTTILAEQHYRKFKERLGDFPVKTEQLSRMVAAKKQRQVLEDLKEGNVDVLFGTHKILQNTVKYKNLGLLIVDEEQRFGVKDKERIKQLRVNIDSLTLSATPIPRTLYMSLLKVRDMSLLTTAPQERLPIKTIIANFDMMRVINAINTELERGGQVFYLHNKIDDLPDITHMLRRHIPSAIIEYAHGQMDGDEIEDIMHRFVYEGIQVLVSTTIIENGIDIPNVNTIIVDRAERFGLSQLYQLRGRVGRGDRQAYCYLMYPDKNSLNEEAVKRLKVLSEHTDLGSGFKVAMKDMEIRGAGNILGQEQSGQLEAVGLDMYMRILDEEIKKLTDGGKSKPEREVFLELDYSGFIPDSYIDNPTTKFEMYKKISSVSTDYALEGLKNELEDRFGEIPSEVDNLLCIAQIRIICKRLHIYHLAENRGIVQLEFGHFASIKPDKVINLLKISNGRVKLDSARINYMKMETSAISLKDKALFILETLKRLE